MPHYHHLKVLVFKNFLYIPESTVKHPKATLRTLNLDTQSMNIYNSIEKLPAHFSNLL